MKKLMILFAIAVVAIFLAPRAGVAAPGQYSCHDVQEFGGARYNERSVRRFFGWSSRRLAPRQLEEAMYETKRCIYERKLETGMGSRGGIFGNAGPQVGGGGSGDVGSAIVEGIFGALLDEALRGQNQNQNQGRDPNNPNQRGGRSGPRDFYLDRMVEAARRIDSLMYQYE